MADPHRTTLDSEQLRHGLESLPQELYDQIYNAVFTARPGVRQIDGLLGTFRRDMKFLHVSSATRALYAKTYYGQGATFEVHGRFAWAQDELQQWLYLLPPDHRALLQRVTVVERTARYSTMSKQWLLAFMRTVMKEIDSKGNERLGAKLFMKVGNTILGQD